jgi:hypothetical protein
MPKGLQMNGFAYAFIVLLSAIFATPALAAQGPGVSQGTAGPVAHTLIALAATALVVFLMAGVVRGAICYWRGARR